MDPFLPFDLNQLPSDLEGVDTATVAAISPATGRSDFFNGRRAPANPDPGAERQTAANEAARLVPASVQTGQRSSSAEEAENQQQRNTNTKPRLSNEVRKCIVDVLLSTSRNNKLQRGVIQAFLQEYNTCYKTIYLLWARAREQMQEGLPIDVDPQMKGCH
ncbi:unnamed protein product [Cuscuta campestris]|uniref:DUF7769 domain-containing protein n=1 Tax=Cuscuta campestris TaxID=132261 RepID=A0A484MBV7_9ASTE|nr:unnamed protein product [Cuscuta campestris]